MRAIKKIIIHCTASDNEEHDDISVIRQWHIKERKWLDVGYHYVISKTKGLQEGRKLEAVGAHCFGQNKHSVGIALCGDKIFSDSQTKTLADVCSVLIHRFKLSVGDIYGHSHFNAGKTCPNISIEIIRRSISDGSKTRIA